MKLFQRIFVNIDDNEDGCCPVEDANETSYGKFFNKETAKEYIDVDFVKYEINRSIFCPQDRTGYETKEELQKRVEKTALEAMKSFPGANGDKEVALCYMVQQLQSVILGAKQRYADLQQKF